MGNIVLSSAIDFQNVCKLFGPLTALENISFSIQRGEFVLLAGPNGAGKSTLMRLITGLVQPTTGVVRINGTKPQFDGTQDTIGFLSHQTSLYNDFSARENLDFFARLYGVTKNKRVENIVAVLGIESFQHRRVRELSSGMKQRIAFGQAILHNPELLLLDEPLDGLDTAGVNTFLEQMEDFRKESKTVVVITHRFDELADLLSYVIVLRRGRLEFNSSWRGDVKQLNSVCA